MADQLLAEAAVVEQLSSSQFAAGPEYWRGLAGFAIAAAAAVVVSAVVVVAAAAVVAVVVVMLWRKSQPVCWKWDA